MGDAETKPLKIFKVGSRKSKLALIQTHQVIDDLKEKYPSYDFEIVEVCTLGDKILDKALPKIGEKSLFTKELEEALENGTVDFVVHSLKDLPTTLPPRKIIGAVLKRVDPRDCVILNDKHTGKTLKDLPKGSVVGTSSLRRVAQIHRRYPNLKADNIRGNLNTRLKKLKELNLFDAIILAAAGVKRMNWESDEILNDDEFLYAVGQGALAVECQESNVEILSLLSSLIHRETVLSVVAERSFLRVLEGGCSAPVAVKSIVENDSISLTGLVLSLNGNDILQETLKSLLTVKAEVRDLTDDATYNSGEPDEKRRKLESSYCGISPGLPLVVDHADMQTASDLGEKLAFNMIKNGAATIMEAARNEIASNS